MKSLKIVKKSISEQIYEHFKSEIEKGKLQPGDRFPSERQLEKELHISRKTVNKAISMLAASGYLFKERGKNTFVAYWENQNRFQASGNDIGFIFAQPTSISHPYLAEIFQHSCELVSERNFGIKLFFVSNGDAMEERLKQAIALKQLKGLFILVDGIVYTMMPDIIADLDLPILTFSPSLFGNIPDLRIYRIFPNEVKALKQAVELLWQKQHRQIAFLYGFSNSISDRNRVEAFRDIVNDLGGNVDEQLILPSEYQRSITCKNTVELLKRSPSAIICADDMVARWVIDYLLSQGFSVPNDMSVIGFNDMEMYSMPLPELTTFKMPARAIAEKAAELLALGKPAEANNPSFIIDYEYIERSTVKTP